jgi:hypothetical protein
MDRELQERLKEFLRITNSLLDSMNQSRNTESDKIWKYAGYWEYARKYNQLIEILLRQTPLETIVDLFDMKKLPGIGDTLPSQQQAYFESVHANLSILKAYLESKIELKANEIVEISSFLQLNLRKAIFDIPEKEVEIQNAVEQLLIGRGMNKGVDYDREVGRVKVSIKEFVPDFIFPRLGLALEIKLSKDKEKSRTIVDEINSDIQSYRKKYSSILFLVYDLGTIRDEIEFKHDLELPDGITVNIVKH